MTPEAVIQFLGERLDQRDLPPGPLTLMPGLTCGDPEKATRAMLRRIELVTNAPEPFQRATREDALSLALAIKEASSD